MTSNRQNVMWLTLPRMAKDPPPEGGAVGACVTIFVVVEVVGVSVVVVVVDVVVEFPEMVVVVTVDVDGGVDDVDVVPESEVVPSFVAGEPVFPVELSLVAEVVGSVPVGGL